MSSSATVCDDPVILDLWHPVVALDELAPSVDHHTRLLGRTIVCGTTTVGERWARIDGPEARSLPVLERYGYLWTSLGEPAELFDIAEMAETDRRVLNAGSIQVATSAPRAIENFLDMGHFPYVHAGLLGAEPRTEVVDYRVDVEVGSHGGDEIWARDCRFYQPVSSAVSATGQVSDYVYRVPHHYCVMLYKTAFPDPDRMDVIALFVQAMDDVRIRAHNFLCMVDVDSSDTDLRRFQQLIFSQDKPVLENQHPRRLPLDPRVEVPIRADRSAITYRRWLTDLGVRYSVIPVGDGVSV